MMLSAYFLFFLFVVLFELRRNKSVFVDFMTLFNLFFVFGYLMPAIIFLLNPQYSYKWRFLAVVPETMESFTVLLAIAVGYLSIVVGYLAGASQKISVYPLTVFKYGEKTQFIMVVFFFAISLVSFMVYVYGHGGIIELLLSGKDIRAGRESAGVYQYFRCLSSGMLLSMLLFYSFKKNSSKVFYRRISGYFLGLSFLLSLISAIGTAGRGKIGMVFLVLLFFGLNCDSVKITVKKVSILLLCSVLVFLLVKYGKSAIWTLGSLEKGISAYVSAFDAHCERYMGDTKGEDAMMVLVGFAKHVDHGIASVYLSLFKPEIYQFPRLFFDWFRAILDVIPGVYQPEFIVSNTPAGLNRDFFHVGGYVPPGWVAMKIINGGFVWLLIGSLIAGFIGGYLNKFLILSWESSPIVPALFIYLAFFWKDSIVGPDPFMVVLPNLSTFLFFCLLVGMLKIKINRLPNVTPHFS